MWKSKFEDYKTRLMLLGGDLNQDNSTLEEEVVGFEPKDHLF